MIFVYGRYTADLEMSPFLATNIKIASLTVDKSSFSANTDVAIKAIIENTGDTTVDTFIKG